MLVTIIRTDTSARTFGLVTLYVRLHHGVYISCVFVGVERLSFTRAWRVGRLLCGSRLLLSQPLRRPSQTYQLGRNGSCLGQSLQDLGTY